MAKVFQYGSNMSVARINSACRLAGDAKPVGIARTAELFELAFTVWSEKNHCAAANLEPSSSGRSIYGVVYDVPDFLLSRDTAKQHNRKSFDQIEGEGTNYVRRTIDLIRTDGTKCSAITYLAKNGKPDLKTSLVYVQHILAGLREHSIPDEYCKYVRSRIIKNNRTLEQELLALVPTRTVEKHSAIECTAEKGYTATAKDLVHPRSLSDQVRNAIRIGSLFLLWPLVITSFILFSVGVYGGVTDSQTARNVGQVSVYAVLGTGTICALHAKKSKWIRGFLGALGAFIGMLVIAFVAGAVKHVSVG